MDIIHIIGMGVAFALIGIVLGRIQGRIIDDQFNGLIANLKSEHIVVRLPLIYKWIGITGSIVLVGLLLVGLYFGSDTFEPWVGFVFGGFASMGIYLVWAQSIWRIDVYRDENFFIYVSSFGRTHKISYHDINYFVDGENYLKLKVAHKTYFIDNKAVNINFLTLMFHDHKVKKMPNNKHSF